MDFDKYEFSHKRTVPDLVAEFKTVTKKLIDDTPMTAGEREQALSQLKAEATDYKNKLYRQRAAEYAKLREKFFLDCRAEMGYDKWLTPRGCERLENEAWDEGHSYGYCEVFVYLQRFVDLVSYLKGEIKYG